MKPKFSVCVYCASRPGTEASHQEVARTVGQWIGAHGGQLVYGGGRNGLMGIVAEATQAAGGRVLGIIPQALVDKEQANRQCDELHIVNTMHERKAMMAQHADAFIALPGGIGTFEELFEIWTWRQIGYHDKPIGILNTQGYYDELLAFIRTSVHSGFMNDWQMEMVRIGAEPAVLLHELVKATGLTA